MLTGMEAGMQVPEARLDLPSRQPGNLVLTRTDPQGSMVSTTILSAAVVEVSRASFNQVYDLVIKRRDLHIDLSYNPVTLIIRILKLTSRHSSYRFDIRTTQAGRHSPISAQTEIRWELWLKGYRLPGLQTGQVFRHHKRKGSSSLVLSSQPSMA